MGSFIKNTVVILCFGFLSLAVFAQDKTQSYYNTHENEILPDARSAFQSGRYERAIELCKWHYIIVGDDAANKLRNISERCDSLSKEMIALSLEGKEDEVKEVANALLSINPNDPEAKRTIEELNKPRLPIISDTVTANKPIAIDSVITDIEMPDIKDDSFDKVAQETEQESIQEPVSIPKDDQVINDIPRPASYSPRTRFVIKGGSLLFSKNQINTDNGQNLNGSLMGYGGSLGIYDIGGSRIGTEVGVTVCPNLLSSISLTGFDASLLIRVGKIFYPKIDVGAFSYKGTAFKTDSFHGLWGGFGVTCLLGDHFCIEASVRGYPTIKILGMEGVYIGEVKYDYPKTMTVLDGGLAAMVRIGWAF